MYIYKESLAIYFILFLHLFCKYLWLQSIIFKKKLFRMIEILSQKIGDMDYSMFTQRFFKANLRIIFHKYTSSQRGGGV